MRRARLSTLLPRVPSILGLTALTAGLVLLPFAQLEAQLGVASSATVVRQAGKLAPHQPVERELGTGQMDVFTVDVAAGQFLHVVAKPIGPDVAVTVENPVLKLWYITTACACADVAVAVEDADGKALITVDSSMGAPSPELLSLVSPRSGVYRVRVRNESPRTSAPGRYRIELTDLRSAKQQDLTRIDAEKEFSRAVREAQSKDSRLKAIERFRRAASLWHSLDDANQEALCLNHIGQTYLILRDNSKALEFFGSAVPLYQAGGDRSGEAAMLEVLGNLYWVYGLNQKALEYLSQVLPLWERLGLRAGEADALLKSGNIYQVIGDPHKALECYGEALPLWRAEGHHLGEAFTLMQIGGTYGGLGELQKALEHLEQALPLLRAVGNRRGEAITLDQIGNIYNSLGERQRALKFYARALPMLRATGDRLSEAQTLGGIAATYAYLGRKQRALEYHRRALLLERAVEDRDDEAGDLSDIGDIYSDLGEKQKALSYLQRALALEQAVGDRGGEAYTLSILGRVYLGEGERQRALQQYVNALRLAYSVSDPDVQALALSGLMRCWEAEHNPGLAVFYGKQAVNEYQQIRRNIQGLDRQLQKSYLGIVTKDYRRVADLLIGQGRLSEAEQVLGLLKEQEFFDYVRRDAAEASSVNDRADLNADEAESDQRYREIADELVRIGAERGELLAKKTLTPEETRRLEQLEKDVAVGNMAFEKFLGDLAQRFSAKPEVNAKVVEQVREEEGIMEDLRELPPGTVAIYTLVGEDKFRAILRTPDAQKAYEYPIKAADLNRKVLEFRDVVQDPKLDPRPLAQELYQILIAPMAEDLHQAKAQTLMWSLDGVLRYLPLVALYDGEQYLIEQYRVSVMTLASNTRLLGRPDAEWRAAGFGVTKAHEGTPALPSVSSELAGIIASKPGDLGVLTGEIKLDDEFTRESMRQTLLKHYPVIHIASHFRFLPGNETKSFLMLGDGAHLSLAELKTSANLFGGVQLLTLSACNTGVGDGTEVEGFGTLAQRQGAKAVIASLWSVADASTSRLMQEFYRIRESSPGMTKLEALREAQLELLRGEVKAEPAAESGFTKAQTLAFKNNAKAPFAHPYYWAPFFLMGNWL